ncbi:hypothetical protein [Amycolatopsis alba]|uniref:Uncharacterized protein n=1 Tax=Amycolatopsis alba DSM 44262 TaxID=1125972 RepID=A0A229R886_AMYAL|nr:hypothetical protein [Amycolatopsis alba]OXM42883.1 hypothetical protein CFP75_40885 [Amycolatopsis alba DSM 44262]
METGHPEGERAPWTAGMISVLRSEAERIRAISRSLEDLAVELRQIDPGGWSGRGHTAYSARRAELAARCRMVAEEHARAARALDDFVAILEQLTRSARYTADQSLLDRLAAQRTEAAARAAATLTEVGEELAGLQAALGGFPRHAPRRSLPSPAPEPRPDVISGRPGPRPGPGMGGLIKDDRWTQTISDGVHRFWSGH